MTSPTMMMSSCTLVPMHWAKRRQLENKGKTFLGHAKLSLVPGTSTMMVIILGSVHPLKLVLKTVLSIQVATGAEVVVAALHTLPADASDLLLRASITHNIGVLDTCRNKTLYLTIGISTFKVTGLSRGGRGQTICSTPFSSHRK